VVDRFRRETSIARLAAAGALTGAALLFSLGLLEALVLYLKRPLPWSAELLGSLLWSPAVYAALGLALGAALGVVVALLGAARGRAVPPLAERSGVWALLLAGLIGFYWVYAANRLYPGTSREPTALALDAAALAAAAVLAALLLRWGRRGLPARTRARASALIILLLWLPLYVPSAQPSTVSTRRLAPVTPPSGVRPPNLLLIMLDTVRADCLSCYGASEFATPNIDRLADEGVLFEEAVTPEPLTRPAVCTMFTGLYPRTHGVDTNTKALRSDFTTLAEILRGRGYATAAFTAASVLSGEYGTAQGFEHYAEPSEPWWYLRNDFAVRRFYISLTSWANWWIEIRADEVNRRATRWLAANGDRPFFAFVHYFDAHWPYDPPAAYDFVAAEGLSAVPAPYQDPQERFAPGFRMPSDYLRMHWLRYRGEIANVDGRVGELLDFLDASGLVDRTVVVLVSDHGESFEHGAYFSHGTRLYDPQVHVAFVIRDPRFGGPTRLPGQVRLIDLFPTVLDLLGVDSGVPAQGVSLVPRMAGVEPGLDLPAFCQTDLEDKRPYSGRASHAVRRPPWKYIESPEIGLTELYDLESDPAETMNLAEEFPEIVDELSSALSEWMAETESLDLPPVELSPDAEAALRTLGYIQ